MSQSGAEGAWRDAIAFGITLGLVGFALVLGFRAAERFAPARAEPLYLTQLIYTADDHQRRTLPIESPFLGEYFWVVTRGARGCRDIVTPGRLRDQISIGRCVVAAFTMRDGSEWELQLKRDRPVLKQKRRGGAT